jgi:hypothetical protein
MYCGLEHSENMAPKSILSVAYRRQPSKEAETIFESFKPPSLLCGRWITLAQDVHCLGLLSLVQTGILR